MVSALPSHPTLTRRKVLGGAGMAVGAVLASSPGMPAIAPAAAQAVSGEPRPLDTAFRRRALEVRNACARSTRSPLSSAWRKPALFARDGYLHQSRHFLHAGQEI
jgi:hypothetical protein